MRNRRGRSRSDLSSARRLVIATIGVLGGFVILTALTQYRETTIARHTAAVIDNAMPSVENLSAARGELGSLRACITRVQPCGVATVERDRAALDAAVARYLALPIFPGEPELQAQLRNELAALDAKTAENGAIQGMDDPAPSAVVARDLSAECQRLDVMLARLVTFNADHAREQSAVIKSSRRASMTLTFAVNVISGAMAAWAVVLVVGALKRATVLGEQVARAHETDFRLLVDSVRDYAIFLLDASGTITSWNLGARELFGYEPGEIIGHHRSQVYPAEAREEAAGHIRTVDSTGTFHEEGWRLRKDGSRFLADVVLTPLRSEDEDRKGFIEVVHDLTFSKSAEEAARQVAVMTASSRTKDEFLATLGHELRNPLAPIVAALGLMKLKKDQGTAREQEILGRQVHQLIRLVDDLLDISRIAGGKLKLSKQTVDVRNAVGKAVEMTTSIAEQRGHHVEVTVAPSLLVEADEARLTQIVANLLANAAKYTEPSGHISLHARRDGEDVFIEVKDDGIGIAPGLLPHIFEPFVQGPRDSSRTGGGLGMGLSIVKNLVEMHGGTVSGASEGVGKGSLFTVRLPGLSDVHAPVAPAPPEEILPPVAPRRVLVVDDNEDALLTLSEVLKAFGHVVLAASDAPAALRAVREFKPDVAILDIGMPGMSGYELAVCIRAELGARAPKLVALTGYGQESDRIQSKEAGFDAHLVKPIDTGELLGTLAS